MKVGINARLLANPTLRGWNRYTINLLVELLDLGVELILYSDAPLDSSHLKRLERGSVAVAVRSGLRYPIWEQFWLPKQCSIDQVDVLHSPFNFGLPWTSPCPRVLTLHDAIDQVFYKAGWSPGALKSRLYHWSSRTRADRIITVSQHAFNEITTALRLDARRVTVIHAAADPRFHKPVSRADRARVRAAFSLGRPYLLYVGGWEARKNVAFLPRALALSGCDDLDLVLVGGRPSEQVELKAMVASMNMNERVRVLGWVDDLDLPALFAEAFAFTYPSFHEGFGLQLCEAAAVGCPVFAADATSLPEVLGQGGALFNPRVEASLATLIRRAVLEPGFRDDLVQRARRRSLDFSWRRNAEATLDVYRDVIKLARANDPARGTA